jgi:glutathione S-transferase
MPNYTAIVILLAVLFYFFTVTKARAKFGIKAPAVSGDPDFERVFRVQMNTLEWMPIFLPSLWLFAIYVSDAGAAAIGLVWIFGRINFKGYSRAAEQRAHAVSRCNRGLHPHLWRLDRRNCEDSLWLTGLASSFWNAGAGRPVGETTYGAHACFKAAKHRRA